jgi:hypothetical protein
VETFYKIMVDESAPHAARLRAAENLGDRGGSPRGYVFSSVEARDVVLAALTEDE